MASPEPLTLVAVAPAGADPEPWRREADRTGYRLIVVENAGPGAALRDALPTIDTPVVGLLVLDYPYRPADLVKLRERLADVPEGMDRPLDLVCGVRTGRPAPPVLAAAGKGLRAFCRVALGLPLDPAPAWLGGREWFRAHLAGVLFGNPFHDPMCGLKLVRKSLFDKFPIQCDGDAAHLELIAKATFVTGLLDEVPLTPDAAPLPRASWRGVGGLLQNPRFTPQLGPADAKPPGPELVAAGGAAPAG